MILPQWFFFFPGSFRKESILSASILFMASSLNREVKTRHRGKREKLPSSRMDRMSRYNLMSAKDFFKEWERKRTFETYFHRQVSRGIYPFVVIVVTWKCLKNPSSLYVQINSCTTLISHHFSTHDTTFLPAHLCPRVKIPSTWKCFRDWIASYYKNLISLKFLHVLEGSEGYNKW